MDFTRKSLSKTYETPPNQVFFGRYVIGFGFYLIVSLNLKKKKTFRDTPNQNLFVLYVIENVRVR